MLTKTPFISLDSIKTKADGNCAFHAAIGKWNGSEYECKEFQQQRKILANKIRASRPGDNLFPLIKAAIEEKLIVGGEGPAIQRLQKIYNEYLSQNKALTNQHWLQFKEHLKQHKDVIKYIKKNITTKKKSITKAAFNKCLNKNAGLLYGIILSIPSLNDKFKEYNSITHQEFNLADYLTPEIIDEYAKQLEQPGKWSLPLELNMLAFALDITISFYTKNMLRKKYVHADTYNPGKSSKVEVGFNGHNHFERMATDSSISELKLQEEIKPHIGIAAPTGEIKPLFAPRIEGSRVEEKKLIKNVSYEQLAQAIDVIRQEYKLKLQNLEKSKNESETSFANIKILSEVKMLRGAIDKELSETKKLKLELKTNEEKFNRCKKESKLLQQQYDEYKKESLELGLEKDIDAKIDWVISRAALKQIKTENQAEAKERKIPLQQATLAGRVKILRDYEKRISDALSEMYAEHKKAQEKQKRLLSENDVLKQDLANKKKELKMCLQDEKEKKSAHDESMHNLKEHVKEIARKVEKYRNTSNDFNKSLTNAKEALSPLKTTQTNLELDIRATELAIQSLEPKRTKKVTVQKTGRRKKYAYNGWIREQLGDAYREDGEEDYTYDVQEDVTDHDIVRQIQEKSRHLLNQKANLATTNASIESKKKKISSLKQENDDHESDWIKEKNRLEKKKFKLENERNYALGKFSDSTANREQKEKEIEHVIQLIASKEKEIELGQQLLDDSQNKIEVFELNLKNCRSDIEKTLDEEKSSQSAAAKLQKVVKVQHKLDPKKTKKLTQDCHNIKLALERAQTSELQLGKDIVDLKAKLELREKHLFELKNPTDKAVVAKRQSEELVYRKQLEVTEKQLNQTRENLTENLHNLFLSQGLILSGYQSTSDSLDNLIICLLQGIFESYPLFNVGIAANRPQPQSWKMHAIKIKSKIIKDINSIDLQQSRLSASTIQKVVDIINEEYYSDGNILKVSLLGNTLPTKSFPAKKTVLLNIWQNKNNFCLLIPESQYMAQGLYGRAHRLVSALLPPHQLFNSLCEQIIRRDCAKSLVECPTDILANYYRKELKSESEKQANFAHWFKELFAGIAIPQHPSTKEQELELQSVHYCLATLSEIINGLSKEQQQELLEICQLHYKTALKSKIINELRKRADSNANAKRKMAESKIEDSDKMRRIENEIKSQDDKIQQWDKTIEKKEEEFLKRKDQANQLQQHYKQQSSEVDAEIIRLSKIKQQIEAELKSILKTNSTNTSRVEELKKLRADVKSQEIALQAEKSQIQSKWDEAKNAQISLQKEKIKIDHDKIKFEKIRKLSEQSKAIEDRKIKILETWKKFINAIHQHLLNDERAFKDRHSILARAKQIQLDGKGDSLDRLYDYLTKNVRCLKELNTPEMRTCLVDAKSKDYNMLSANWFNDLQYVLDDILGSPKIHMDGLTPITVSGNNISWAEVQDELKKAIEKRIKHFGLKFNAQNKLELENIDLLGIINQLPDRLKNLFARHIELHYKHYTILNEKKVDQTPRWTMREEFISASHITTFLQQAKIDFLEVLRAYGDSIELVVGHNLYLDIDIYLPGINVTFFSKERIHCKDKLIIDTTPSTLPEIQIEKASHGDDYQSEIGRDGDDGLDGPAGDCAGHIILKAEKTILNLEKIKFIANAGNGLNGQKAGDGGKGRKGMDMSDAEADDTDGFGQAQYVIAQGKIPGMDANGEFTLKNQISGPGGNAGLAGWGGEAGLAGDIVIQDQKNEVRILTTAESVGSKVLVKNVEQKPGKAGSKADRNAKGGPSGEPGAEGKDHVRIKKSFFHKTDSSRVKVDKRIFQHPEEYLRSDAALGFHISPTAGALLMLKQKLRHTGYCDRYHQQIMGYGNYIDVPIEKDHQRISSRYKGSRGEDGEDNARRKKPESKRRKTQQSKTIRAQLAQLTRIGQIATRIQQTHAILKYENNYDAEIAKYRARSEELGREIEHCRSQEADCAKRSAETAEKLQQVEQTIHQLESKLQEINNLIKQAHKKINAADLAQLENFKRSVEVSSQCIQAQTELACADIDVSSEKSAAIRLAELHIAIQNAIQVCQNALSQAIESDKAERLVQTQRLADLKEEYARLQQAYQDKAATKSSESHLENLIEELLQADKHQQKETETTEQLANSKQHASKETDSKPMPISSESFEERDIFFNAPTLEMQYKKVLSLFCDMFGTDGIYKELESELKSELEKKTEKEAETTYEADKFWSITLNGLRLELKKLRDVTWMKKNIVKWKRLLKYCENILKISNYSIAGLNSIYLQIQPIAEQLEKIDSQIQGKCSAALKDLSDTLDQRYIDHLIDQCANNIPEGKQRSQHKQVLEEEFKKALLVRCTTNPPIGFVQQLKNKLNFFKSISSLIARKTEEKEPNLSAEVINFVLSNTLRSYPIVNEEKDSFLLEVQDLAKKFNINVIDDKRNCSLVLASDNVNISNIEKNYDAAYIIQGEKLFYTCKGSKAKEISNVDIKDLFTHFTKFKNTQLSTGEQFKTLSQILSYDDLQNILSITNHEHLTRVDSQFYYENLQLEIEYLNASIQASLHQLDEKLEFSVLQREKYIARVGLGKKKLLAMVSAFKNANSPYTQALFHQIAQNHQTLILLEKRAQYSDLLIRDAKEEFNPIKSFTLLKELYIESTSYLTIFNTKFKKELKKLAYSTLAHFINDVEITPEQWIAIVSTTENADFLKKNHGHLLLLIIEKITASHQVKHIHQAFECCEYILSHDAKFNETVKRQFENAWLAILAKQLEFCEESLQGKPDNIRQDIQKSLQQIRELWFSPHCALSMKERILALQDIKLMIENSKIDLQLMSTHHAKQKQLLISSITKDIDEKELKITFATGFQVAIKKIGLHLQLPKLEENKSNLLLHFFDTFLTTLQLLIKNTPEHVTSNELEEIEKSYHALNRLLIINRPVNNESKNHLIFWAAMYDRLQILNSALSKSFRNIITAGFKHAKEQRQEGRKKLNEIVTKISAYHHTCLQLKQDLKIKRSAPEEKMMKSKRKTSPAKEDKGDDRLSHYLMAQKKFVTLLLKKLELAYLTQRDEKHAEGMDLACFQFEKIYSFIKTIDSKSETALTQIEDYLVTKVNEIGNLIIKAEDLFAEEKRPGELNEKFNHLRQAISSTHFNKILHAWQQAFNDILSYAEKESGDPKFIFDKKWFKQFIIDSNKLFSSVLPENVKQEESIIDLQVRIKSWYENIFIGGDTETTLAIKNFIKTLNYSVHRSNHYLYVNRLLDIQIHDRTLLGVDQQLEKIEETILQATDKTFADIRYDLASSVSQFKLATMLTNIKPAYTPKEIKEQLATLNHILQDAEDKLCSIDEKEVSTQSIERISKVKTTESLKNFTFLRKLFLNIKNLQVEQLEDIHSFATIFIKFLADRSLDKTPEQTYYSNIIANYLATLYRVQYLKLVEKQTEKTAIANQIDHINSVNQRADILFASYFQLCCLEKKEQKQQEIQQAKGTKILTALLNETSLKPTDIYGQFKTALADKASAWKIPHFMTMLPLFSAEEFSKIQYETTIQSLCKLISKEINLDFKQRILLLQIMLATYVRNYILPSLKEDDKKGLILRVLAYIDKICIDCIQDEEKNISQQIQLQKISQGYLIINKLTHQSLKNVIASANVKEEKRAPQSLSTSAKLAIKLPPAAAINVFDIQNLLDPIESKLSNIISQLSSDNITSLLVDKSPDQWETLLRDLYFETIKREFTHTKHAAPSDIASFDELFTSAYVLAQKNRGAGDDNYINEINWLTCINYLLTATKQAQLNLKHVNLVLKSALFVGNVDHIYFNQYQNFHPLNFVKECLFAECIDAIQRNVKDKESLKAILQQFNDLKLAIFNEDTGLLFLRKLSNALFLYYNNEKSIYPAYLNELFSLVKETRAFKQQHLLIERNPELLDSNNILLWNGQLKRENYVQIFGLQDYGVSADINKLVHQLNQLEKEKSANIVNRLIKLLRKHSVIYNTPKTVNEFIERFVNQKWELDEKVLNYLETNPQTTWIPYLIKFEIRFTLPTNDDRKAAEIITEMQKEADGINKHVRKLIDRDEKNQTEIEKQIAAIQAKSLGEINGKPLATWTEEDIKNWAAAFKAHAVQSLNNPDTVAELVAVIVRACQLKKPKTPPRDTQLTALLLFIDAIQKGKGRLANISTGEGKSLITMMSAIVCALRNETVDIVTSNEVLAERDAKSAEELLGLFGIKVSNNCDKECDKNEDLRKERYKNCQVIYGTTSSFQRDMLLTAFFGKPIRGTPGQSITGNRLILDEVDSMFIDNAEKILYISHPIQDLRHLSDLFITIWAAVNSDERAENNINNVNAIARFIQQRIDDKSLVLPNLLTKFIKRRLKTWIKSAYKAKEMEKDKEYIIPEKHNKIVIMDLDTGVEQMTMQWSDGLHQFLQLKHSQKLDSESLKAVFMANAIFFKAYNGQIIGMTGTLGSDLEMDLMSSLYQIDYFRLPRNKPERYIQEEGIAIGCTGDDVQSARENWKNAILQEIRDKQSAKGTVKQEEREQAEKDFAAAEKRLTEIEPERASWQAKLDEIIKKEKSLVQEINDLISKLGQDAIISESKDQKNIPVSRETWVKEQKIKENELKICRDQINEHQLKLSELESGVNGRIDTENKKRNADYIKQNSGARALLIICQTVKDVEELAAAVESAKKADETLAPCKIWKLKSKDDPLPGKLGPHDIVIATNIAGRGTDLETLDILEKNEGLHVLLTYIPPNIRVAIQALRRTARNGNRGSGRFIVYNARFKKDDPLLTVEYLREACDREEALRLDKIRTQGIPKLERENALFLKFIDLQKRIKEKLEAQLHEPKDFDQRWVSVQLKSLQNKWAFFLDKINNKIEKVTEVSEEQLMEKFQKFEARILKEFESIPFRLITEPAELMQMARHCMDKELAKNFSMEESYQLAIEYLDKIIEDEPNFSGFAHYFKAHCNFGLKRNSLQNKAAARTSLKRAIDLIEEKVSRLSTSLQFIRILRGRKQEDLGYGLEVDEFTRSITNEISLIQVHLNAAREALGTELTPDSFKSGTVTGDEHKAVFENVRKHFRSAVIKDFRLSKKVILDEKTGKLERSGKVVDIPPAFAAFRDKIIEMIKPMIGGDLEKRQFSPDSFKNLFITKNIFLNGIEGHFTKQLAISLHADADVNAKGQWDTPAFSDCKTDTIQAIKTYILNIQGSKPAEDILKDIVALGVSKDKAQVMLQDLGKRSILKANEIYQLNKDIQTKIKDYLENIYISDEADLDFSKINLSNFPELRDKEVAIKQLLRPGAVLTRENLSLDQKAFNLLFHLLKENKFFKMTLIQKLGLGEKFSNSWHHRDIESELLRIYASNLAEESSEISLCTDASEKCMQLWSYFKSMKVVKDPAVKFKLNDDPSELLSSIKKTIEDKINLLIPNKSKDEQEKYVKSIYNTLEKSIGKIKQIKDLKIDPKTLQYFLQGGKVPPELMDITQQCYDIVLALAEDKGWDWNVFACALIGVLQIAAGVIIGALTFGGAAFISSVLISEGIGDLIFAVQCGINGNFSWAAYGERKWQSLLISIATAGIGIGLGTVASTTANALSTSVAALAQTFAVELAKAGLACAVSLATDQLVKHVLSSVINELEGKFGEWVKSSASYQAAEKRLENLIGRFYDRFGVNEAGMIINRVILENAEARQGNFANVFGSKLTEVMQKLSGHLSIASDQLSAAGNSTAAVIATISKIAGHVATAVDVINKFREIASLTAESLETFEKSLERAYLKSAPAPEMVALANRSKSKEKFSEEILKKQTQTIVNEIKQFIKRGVMQPGMQALLQMAVKPVNEMLKDGLSESLKELNKKMQKSTHGKDDVSKLASSASATEEKAKSGEAKTVLVTSAENKSHQSHKASRAPAGVMSDAPAGENKKPLSFSEKTQHRDQPTMSRSQTPVTSAALTMQGGKELDWGTRGSHCVQMVLGGIGVLGSTSISATGAGAILGAASGTYSFDQFMTGLDGCFFNYSHDTMLHSLSQHHFPNFTREMDIMMPAFSAFLPVGAMSLATDSLRAMPAYFSLARGALKDISFFSSTKAEARIVDSGSYAASHTNLLRLQEQLTRSAESSERRALFTSTGELTPDAIKNSELIIRGEKLGNATLKDEFRRITGTVSGWGKYETQSAAGIKVHFYHNSETGHVLYSNPDYKSIFNHQGAGHKGTSIIRDGQSFTYEPSKIKQ